MAAVYVYSRRLMIIKVEIVILMRSLIGCHVFDGDDKARCIALMDCRSTSEISADSIYD